MKKLFLLSILFILCAAGVQPVEAAMDGQGGSWINVPQPPGAFTKLSPGDGAANQPIDIVLTWSESPRTQYYEYCLSTTLEPPCTAWTSTLGATSASPPGLAYHTTYYWQVRANNASGTTFADGGETVYFSFTTRATPPPPAAFNRLSPTDGAVDQPLSLALDWEDSTRAAGYEYCLYTAGEGECTKWTDTALESTALLSDLSYSTTYYWQVRAYNLGGTTYAAGGETSFWSFTTEPPPPPPGDFDKISPADGAGGLPLTVTLDWSDSLDVDEYQFCYYTAEEGACTRWAGAAATSSTVLNDLSYSTTYFWQVRATNLNGTTYADASEASFFSFTTQDAPPPPGPFGKISPADGAGGLPTTLTLDWENSAGADEYEYCLADTLDEPCTGWTSTAATSGVTLTGLDYSATYYWQARAANAHGETYADGLETSYWSFTIQPPPPPPGNFGKISPENSTQGLPLSVTLDWAASAGAAEYEYCISKTLEQPCTPWISTALTTSASLTGLDYSTTYYWQVRAWNDSGTTYADGEAFIWTFSTLPELLPAGNFSKIAPSNGALRQGTTVTLSWAASDGADEYYYCIDDTDDGLCSQWFSTTATSVEISGLRYSTTYYWQVRAVNGAGDTYADGAITSFWSFTTSRSQVFLPFVRR